MLPPFFIPCFTKSLLCAILKADFSGKGILLLKIFAPDYYRDFRCIAGDCKHSCCIGWEIDVDEETAEIYKNVPGDFGKKLRENIDFSEEGGSFRLCENDSCPFLNDKNLCEIYINLGEESLSQICSDHPRFRNFYECRTEIGLGLCCEEAARLILTKESKTEIIEIGEDGEEPYFYEDEAEFFEMRSRIFSEVQNREKPFAERVKNACRILGSEVPEFDLAKWAKICLGLERLDESWTGVLENIVKNPAPPEISDETAAEQLFCYFVFRHFCPEYQKTSLAFCLLSFFMTEKAAEQTGISEAARLWSSETEYSSENKPLLLSTLFEEGV